MNLLRAVRSSGSFFASTEACSNIGIRTPLKPMDLNWRREGTEIKK